MLHLHATRDEALLQAPRGLPGLRKPQEDAGPPTSVAGLVEYLECTRRGLRRHFAHEEQGDYLASVLELRPHLARAVQRLEDEHRALMQGLDDVLAEARAAGVVGDDLARKVRDWAEGARRHERSENLLVLDAFTLDLSAGD